MGIIEWATSPLGQNVPIHIAWFLIWVALIAGLLFLVVHAIYLRYFAKEKEFAADASATIASQLPARIPRHSLAARLFHWIMAASMFVLLFTAFLPKVGVQFDWVTYHWIAGTVLTVSILFHIIHATFYMDFWSVCPAPEIRQVSAGEQALPWRHHRDRAVGDCDRRFYDVPCTHHFLSPQSVPVQRHDLGPHVCAARPGWRRTHHAGHRARLFCHPAREAPHHCLHDRRLNEPRLLLERT